ncbi:MAG: leucine-rich repeat domain-containing protein [Treponema sp.]|nr:leucine-rich repeat domain-containing protein [Treponema sp.]
MIKQQIIMPCKRRYGRGKTAGILRGFLTALSSIALAMFSIGAFMACSQEEDAPSTVQQEYATGRVYIQIAKTEKQRIVYPDLSGFVKFTLIFTREDGKSAPDVVLEEETSTEITLEPGDWNITATGWVDGEDSELTEAAYGNAKALVVAGETTKVGILLDKPAVEEGMEGMFEWRIHFPETTETASMILSALGSDGTFSIPINTLNLFEESEGSMSLPSGYYRVDVALSTDYGEIGRSEIIYIYSGLVTVLPDMEFTANDFPPRSEPEDSRLEISIGMKIWDEDAMDIRGLPDKPMILSQTGAMGFPDALSLTASGFTWIECLVDGKQVVPTVSGAEATFIIDSKELRDGRHFLSFIGMKNGVPHGREALLTVISSHEMNGVESLAETLAALPPNTQENPYPIKMNGVNLSGRGETGNTLRALYDALEAAERYVALDLSGSEGNAFASITLKTAKGKQYIASIVLPHSITVIDTNAFAGCAALVSAEMPGVLTINQGAFDSCENLESISLPEATDIINTTASGYGAFYKCIKLTSVYAPKVETIAHRSFYGCASLADISLPSVTQIGEYAFKGCSNLVNIAMPQTVVIDSNAFTGSGFVLN